MILEEYLNNRGIDQFVVDPDSLDFDSVREFNEACQLFGLFPGNKKRITLPVEPHIMFTAQLSMAKNELWINYEEPRYVVIYSVYNKGFLNLIDAQDFLEKSQDLEKLTVL